MLASVLRTTCAVLFVFLFFAIPGLAFPVLARNPISLTFATVFNNSQSQYSTNSSKRTIGALEHSRRGAEAEKESVSLLGRQFSSDSAISIMPANAFPIHNDNKSTLEPSPSVSFRKQLEKWAPLVAVVALFPILWTVFLIYARITRHRNRKLARQDTYTGGHWRYRRSIQRQDSLRRQRPDENHLRPGDNGIVGGVIHTRTLPMIDERTPTTILHPNSNSAYPAYLSSHPVTDPGQNEGLNELGEAPPAYRPFCRSSPTQRTSEQPIELNDFAAKPPNYDSTRAATNQTGLIVERSEPSRPSRARVAVEREWGHVDTRGIGRRNPAVAAARRATRFLGP